MAEDLPPAVQKAIAENKRDCKTVALEKGFITRKDINGDGRPDFVLDYEFFICDGNPRAFCGSIGCATQVLPPFQMAPTQRSSTRMSGGSIFVRSRGGRRSLLAWPATQILVERTRPRFAKSSNPGTARPSWTCPPRERVERPESRMENRSVRSERSSRKSSPCTARAKWAPSRLMRSCASTSPLNSYRYGTVQWRETTVRSTQTRLRTRGGTR